MKKKVFFLVLISVFISASNLKNISSSIPDCPLPNILWITCEDISPYLGCYGDKNATTPNLDKLASEGTLYSNAYANAPVCAPARFTIISGMYASSAGTHHMRSTNKIPENIRFYPEYLREAGYYCTNNLKTDYNCTGYGDLWDESSEKAHYKNRKPGQPFFAIFNLTITHESQIHRYDPNNLIHNPSKMELPPYHPDLPEVRNDWARLYDNITTMDKQAGDLLKELEQSGLKESTIIFFYGDHGGVLPRSKRFIFNTGTQVPFLTRIPELYKDLSPGAPGNKNERLISFVDLAPTLLSLAGIPKPDNMQGDAFLGEYTEDKPDYVYFFRGRMDERYDMMRGITDGHYRYIINFMPHRPYAQHLNYLWRASSMQVWEKAYLNGLCNKIQSRFFGTKPFEELYDTKADPWEVNNLASDQEHADVLKKMRQVMKNHILKLNDGGFIPEGEYANIESTSLYNYFQSDNYKLEEIFDVASIAAKGDKQNLDFMVESLKSPNQYIRYWAATGCAILGENAKKAKHELELCLTDESPDVRIAAAESLYQIGGKQEAIKTLGEILQDDNQYVVLHALNVINELGNEVIIALDTEIETVMNKYKADYYIERTIEYFKTRN